MAPHLAATATYAYKPLAARRIRLLKLPKDIDSQCQQAPALVDVSLDTPPAYETVSYVWGEQIKSCLFNFSFGTSVAVTPTLRTTIERLRPHCQTCYLWVDQLCIDQASIPDRNQQVALMGEIYSNCQRVMIWLGQEVQNSGYLAYYFNDGLPPKLQRKTNHTRVSSSRLEQPDAQSFIRFLLALTWFTRAWVVQEAVLPPKASCFLGPFTFSIEDLWAVVVHHRAAERYFVQIDYSSIRQHPGYFVLNEIMRLRQQERYRSKRTHNPAICFYHSLSIFGPRCMTTSRHDIIYSFLGLQRDPRVRIVPDYDLDWSVVPVIATSTICEATESLNLFGMLHRKAGDESRWPSLPSWVPDWSRRLEAEPMVFPRSWMYFNSASGMAHKARKPSGLPASHLVVRGKIISEVAHTFPFSRGGGEPLANRHGWDVCSYLNIRRLHHLLKKTWPNDTTAPPIVRLLKVILADGSFTLNQKLREHCSEGLLDSDIDELAATYWFLESLVKQEDTETTDRPKMDDDDMMGKRATRLRDHARVAWGRQLIVSRDWRLGLAHVTAHEGDVICIVHGSKVPLMLRRLQSGRYRLIGQCYFESAMRGEEVTWGEDDADEFILE
ncbi:HET-domain-containing protein [Alternaria alternata]|jgi:hypothetical protein|uniref:HET-domain-containing protein n=2 Tax=Alternaria alternata complex TaxID=187734 RepID=A0A177DLB1_ALTAL|nr:HET-domain-containing protein [Alternaria alternata]OAG20515.1 HET-domain-containing protein [Alternaria alternata]RYN40472.1 hypothetical protein AA0114_g11046 [Alternaria tenuissima]RYN92004.1 hypothetical protein AA0120_g5672 [Alternaria tenuissima]